MKDFPNFPGGKLLIDLSLPVSPAGWMLGKHQKKRTRACGRLTLKVMKTKILLLSVVSILILAIAAGAWWRLRRPQMITFSDDSKVTLLAAEYGKRHSPPA